MRETIVFVGGGNMATSLIGGLIAQDHPAGRLRVVDPDTQRLAALRERFGVAVSERADAEFMAADVWVLAVKPQVMAEIATALADKLGTPPPLVLSVAAGVPSRALARWFGADVPIVRCMPNTPALIGAGAAGLYAADNVEPRQRETAEAVLGSAGITVWVEDEAALDAVTATSGSGPAYFFAFMEALQSGAEELGLDAETARRLVLQTALGAARMALESGDNPAELRRKVTSPGGTTERALTILEEGGFDMLVGEAMRAAAGRSAQISEELNK